jgi:hypothetical protein
MILSVESFLWGASVVVRHLLTWPESVHRKLKEMWLLSFAIVIGLPIAAIISVRWVKYVDACGRAEPSQRTLSEILRDPHPFVEGYTSAYWLVWIPQRDPALEQQRRLLVLWMVGFGVGAGLFLAVVAWRVLI